MIIVLTNLSRVEISSETLVETHVKLLESFSSFTLSAVSEKYSIETLTILFVSFISYCQSEHHGLCVWYLCVSLCAGDSMWTAVWLLVWCPLWCVVSGHHCHRAGRRRPTTGRDAPGQSALQNTTVRDTRGSYTHTALTKDWETWGHRGRNRWKWR